MSLLFLICIISEAGTTSPDVSLDLDLPVSCLKRSIALEANSALELLPYTQPFISSG